jgi:hypothetical protein
VRCQGNMRNSALFRVTYEMGGTHMRPILLVSHHIQASRLDIENVLRMPIEKEDDHPTRSTSQERFLPRSS